jgi:hypothetical protein
MQEGPHDLAPRRVEEVAHAALVQRQRHPRGGQRVSGLVGGDGRVGEEQHAVDVHAQEHSRGDEGGLRDETTARPGPAHGAARPSPIGGIS